VHKTRYNDVYWNDGASKEFLNRFVDVDNNGFLWNSQEHLTFYSRRQLKEMSKALSEGCHGISEWSSATMTVAFGNKLISIDEEDIGEVWVRSSNRHVPRAMFEEHQRRNVSKLFHPCKW